MRVPVHGRARGRQRVRCLGDESGGGHRARQVREDAHHVGFRSSCELAGLRCDALSLGRAALSFRDVQETVIEFNGEFEEMGVFGDDALGLRTRRVMQARRAGLQFAVRAHARGDASHRSNPLDAIGLRDARGRELDGLRGVEFVSEASYVVSDLVDRGHVIVSGRVKRDRRKVQWQSRSVSFMGGDGCVVTMPALSDYSWALGVGIEIAQVKDVGGGVELVESCERDADRTPVLHSKHDCVAFLGGSNDIANVSLGATWAEHRHDRR